MVPICGDFVMIGAECKNFDVLSFVYMLMNFCSKNQSRASYYNIFLSPLFWDIQQDQSINQVMKILRMAEAFNV